MQQLTFCLREQHVLFTVHTHTLHTKAAYETHRHNDLLIP